MFAGLSAFPLTPLHSGEPDQWALRELVAGLAPSGVDSIAVLGSTGSYPYLTREQRRDTARTAVDAADGLPVLVGVGALTTREVLTHVGDAIDAGAAGVLLAPVSYQPLTDEEVLGLYQDVTSRFTIPLVVYDNPRTTGFDFSEQLHGRIGNLPNVASVKLPPLPPDPARAAQRVAALRGVLADRVTIGISGDAAAAGGLRAGCDSWYSVAAGLFPRTCVAIARAGLAGDHEHASVLSAELDPLWALFDRFGSFRVASAIAVETGLLGEESVHRPVLPLQGEDRAVVRATLAAVQHRSSTPLA